MLRDRLDLDSCPHGLAMSSVSLLLLISFLLGELNAIQGAGIFAGVLLTLMQAAALSPRELFRRCAAVPPLEAAWREFDKRYGQDLSAGICRIIGFPPSAKCRELFEDLLQSVYCRLLQHERRALHAFRGQSEGEARAYLRRVASSVALNEVRRRNLVLRSPDGELPDPPVEDSLLQQILERLSLDDALDRVLRGRNKDRNMLAFKMHVYEGCNAAEIAGILGMNVTPRAVENQLSRMRTKLQKFLGLD